jgi:hypothetical protein
MVAVGRLAADEKLALLIQPLDAVYMVSWPVVCKEAMVTIHLTYCHGRHPGG